MGTSSRNRLQTISTHSAARSIWVVPPPLNQTPRKISTDSSFTLTIIGELGSPCGPGEGKGPKRLPPPTPAHSVHPPLGRGAGRGREALKGAPPFSPPGAHSYFLSEPQLNRLWPGVARRGREQEKGTGADSRGRALAPGRRAGGPGSWTPPPGRPGKAGALGSARGRPAPGAHQGPPPPPAAEAHGPSLLIPEAGAPGDALAPGPPPPLPPARAGAHEKR